MSLSRTQTLREKRIAIEQFAMKTSFRAGLLVLAVVLIVLDVTQTSAVSTKGYEINQYQTEIRQLERENRKLEVEISKHRSVESIQERLQGLDLVVAEQPRYVSLVGPTVALR
ncbi:MAG: hypothetical protein COU33_05005 [Candidatus Magasanikbacteria bacterium CG10_big_fil_rev_8_21_14_0_10_43_6]|uniref:Cell division protein FtsL n=1 Tax=Candidatus Magasanikbacteria bacterium CG10_big_fil_rev_8_21_14_0_10_43_6 TaxID=1974650 RepID=A0A2M6W075_9BACT|nr:MAG: hypothetical protein COU33_05005 [Candidatus Magasanikbacteria bacterium CG10_big_fil_rev_8_21_14_0_10_43_6]